MTIVHFATELSGGAGGFVRHLHLTMQGMGLPSLVLTRDRSELDGVVTLQPISRVAGSLRARTLTMLGKLGVLDNTYAMFGIEKCPVRLADIEQALKGIQPAAFVFYWTSYSVDFDTMAQLRRAYPAVPIVLTCTDEAFLTGGCHYTHGCEGYQQSCQGCPATNMQWLQRRIEQGFLRRQTLIDEVDPIVVYPTTNMQDMGRRSSLTRHERGHVIPLGAMTIQDQNQALARRLRMTSREHHGVHAGQRTLLVRSSSELRKGCDLFVSALLALSRAEPDLRARLRVVSIGDDMLTDARIDQYVEHEPRGYVNREELLLIYSEVDACIITSREDAGPLMTNECVAMGIYVMSTPIGVAKDLISSPRQGQILRNVSAEAMGEALLVWLNRGVEEADHDTSQDARTPSLSESLTFEGYIRVMTHLLKDMQSLACPGLADVPCMP